VKVLFATAELAPQVKVGGLADFSAGLTNVLESQGIEVNLVLPDYGGLPLEASFEHDLAVPEWAAPAMARQGILGGVEVTLLSVNEMARRHPYHDGHGSAWTDNDLRFFGFSAAVAAWVEATQPDVVHLNDWHTAVTPAFLIDPWPTVFTIHNLAYQGATDAAWLDRFPQHGHRFFHDGRANPMAGAIALADRVVTVSPTFAEESLPPNHGFGLAELLESRAKDFLGILNGIDTEVWDSSADPHLPFNYDLATLGEKSRVRATLLEELGWVDNGRPLIGMVTRLTDQKGVDVALETVPALEELEARMVLLGAGDLGLVEACSEASRSFPEWFVFADRHDEGLAHRIFGGSDLYLMPSRFEPGGLTQMQAMRYGAIPVVTDVGGLHDTVVDADARPECGTGFVAERATPSDVTDALARAVTAWRSPDRRQSIIERGMTTDWSWHQPALRYIDLYEEVMSARR
jgi:starch synthase